MDTTEQKIADALLEIGAVFLRPDDPFLWASGIRSPIYCDNRLILSYPEIRSMVERALADMIKRHYPDAQLLAGTSTAGIAHAAIAAELLRLPMAYVRGRGKDHGRRNRIEGRIAAGQKAVVVEDLISTAGSAAEAAEAVREAGAEVLGIASIFTYEMQKGVDRLAKAGLGNVSLCGYSALVETAAASGYITPSGIKKLSAFQKNPSDESWMER